MQPGEGKGFAAGNGNPSNRALLFCAFCGMMVKICTAGGAKEVTEMKKWIDRYQGALREKIDWMCFHRMEDPERTKKTAAELLEVGNANQDQALLGMAHYHLAFVLYFQTNLQQSMQEPRQPLYTWKNPMPRH